MIKRFLCLVLALLGLLGSLSAVADTPSTLSYSDILQEVWSTAGCSSLQNYLDTVLCDGAGAGAEHLVYSLMVSGSDLDYSSFYSACRFLLPADTLSAATRQNLALLFCFEKDLVTAKAFAKDTVGRGGVLSVIYACHLSQREGVIEQSYSQLSQRLLSLQCADGGWSLMGVHGDVDVTAMALQALSYEYAGHPQVLKGMEFLRSAQLANGQFSSYGQENCESACQVVLALCSLGLDPSVQTEFSKNGRSLVDLVASYRVPGGFSHVKDGSVNFMATAQGLLAVLARERLLEQEGSIWETTAHNPSPPPTSSAMLSTAGSASTDKTEGGSYPYALGGAVLGLGLVCALLLVIFRKRKTQNFILLFLVTCLLLGLLSFVKIQTPEQFYQPPAQTQESVGTVTVTIRCRTLDTEKIFLEDLVVSLYPQDSVYDITLRAAKIAGLILSWKGTGSFAYLHGVENVYEFQHGELSGWMYFVNGIEAGVGCGQYRPLDGDCILWEYSLERGKDL